MATAKASDTTARVRWTTLNATARVSSRRRLRTNTAQMKTVQPAASRRMRVSRRDMGGTLPVARLGPAVTVPKTALPEVPDEAGDAAPGNVVHEHPGAA